MFLWDISNKLITAIKQPKTSNVFFKVQVFIEAVSQRAHRKKTFAHSDVGAFIGKPAVYVERLIEHMAPLFVVCLTGHLFQ